MSVINSKVRLNTLKHWTQRVIDDKWLFIACPIMEKGDLNFKQTLQVFRELREIENFTKKQKELLGVCCKTWVGNMHIMKFLYRMGYTTYREENNNYYFKKEV